MTAPIKVTIEEDIFLPRYRHLLNSTADINFLYGGRDSGKSHFIAQMMLVLCMRLPYFRCILIKKTFNSIHESQYRVLKDICNEWGISHLFDFRTSPLKIICRANGNEFLCRGADDPENLKSITNPSHCWIEEGNQLTQSDYSTISTTLRSNKGDVQQWFSFNPECEGDFNDFWLFKTFFKDYHEKGISSFNHTAEITLQDGSTYSRSYTATHSTYLDNPYCTAQRRAEIESLKSLDKYKYQVYALGQWGRRETRNPFATAFDESKHTGPQPAYDYRKEVILAMDFNIDPFAFSFWHYWRDQAGEHLHCFDERAIMNASIHDAVSHIKERYPQSIPFMKITGDPGGKNRNFSQRDNATLYQQLARELKLKAAQLIVPSAPTHINSRADCNYFLYHFPDFKISKSCTGLIFDMKYVEVDEEGSIIKQNRKEQAQRSDFCDGFRYLINTFFREWIIRHQKRK